METYEQNLIQKEGKKRGEVKFYSLSSLFLKSERISPSYINFRGGQEGIPTKTCIMQM